ncbi:hypothetical protein KAR91_18360, partial [Candidatus Pacearchaeota archaeon]|nr:hypothetical protein [Candidatus Pacearchaeota archaeon]
SSFSGACVDKNTTFRLANLKRCNLEIIDAVDGRMDLRYARNLHNTSRLPMGMLPNFFIILDKYRTELRKRKFIKFFIKRSRAEKLIVKLFTLKEDSEDIFLRNATVEIIGCLLFAQKTLIAESRQLGCVGGENYMLKIINEELKKIQDNYFGGTKPRDFFDKCESKYDKSVFGKEKKIMRKLFSKTASCVGNKTICENISILTADWKNKQSSKKGGYLSAIVKFFLRKSKRRSKYKLDLKNRR